MSSATDGPEAAEDLEVRLPASPEAVGELRWAARDFALGIGAGDGQAGDVMLAVSEAVTNTVKHAYPGTGGGDIEMVLTLKNDDTLEITVRDEGCGFRGDQPGGLGAGLMLIGECADEVEIEQGDTGVRVAMTFRLDRRSADSGVQEHP